MEIDKNTMPIAGIMDLVLSFPPLKMILSTGNFNHFSFPFRLFRYCTAIYNAGKNTSLQEQIWYFSFIGREIGEIQQALNKFREKEASLNSPLSLPSSQEQQCARSSVYTQPPVTPKKVSRSNLGVSVHVTQVQRSKSARAHITPDARAQIAENLDISGPNTSNLYSPSYIVLVGRSGSRAGRSDCNINQRNYQEQDPGFVQAKKGISVEHYFKYRKFSASPSQSVDNAI